MEADQCTDQATDQPSASRQESSQEPSQEPSRGLSQEAIDSAAQLYNAIRGPFPETVSLFEELWEALQKACPSQPTSTSDDSCVRTDEFNIFKKFGLKNVPLVVYKLAKDNTGENACGVFLYNALENDPTYQLSLNGLDLRSCSARIVELNYQRNKIVETRIKAWKQVHQDNIMAASSRASTLTDEYDDLLEMGTSIIAPLMVAFHED